MFNGIHVIENAITEREIDIIYRYLAISENLGHLKGNNDSTSAHMYYATPYFEAMLSYYCDLVSDIVNEEVYPSYSFLWKKVNIAGWRKPLSISGFIVEKPLLPLKVKGR